MTEREEGFLFIDTDPIYLEAIKSISSELPLKVFAAAEDIEAEGLLKDPEVHLRGVLMDYGRRDFGIEMLINRIRSLDPNMPLIYYTADNVDEDLTKRFQSMGFDKVVEKGNLEDLEKLINSFPEIRQSRSTLPDRT